MWGRRSGSMCIVPHLGPKRRALFSGPVPISMNLGPLFPLMTGPRAAASRKNWGPLPASTLQHRPMN